MSTPKERPILFSSTMVRAILDGAKTQTRRIIKNQPKIDDLVMYCPYGKPGDRLWVRETWGVCTKGADIMAGTHWENPLYRADADNYGLLCHDVDGAVYQDDILWKPSIHMPRLASRINLEITGIRIERLQDISDEDAKSEGVECWRNIETLKGLMACSAHRYEFEDLWKSINGKGSWILNPFVWVVEFKKV